MLRRNSAELLAYNINGQPQKTLEVFEREIVRKQRIELDAVVATCVLSACSDCHRLDIGEYVHDEIVRLKLLQTSDGTPNVRLVTAVRIDLDQGSSFFA